MATLTFADMEQVCQGYLSGCHNSPIVIVVEDGKYANLWCETSYSDDPLDIGHQLSITAIKPAFAVAN